MSEQQQHAENRARPTTDEFRAFVQRDWAPRPSTLPALTEAARYAAARRATVSAQFPGERLIIPAGGLKVRSNDCDYVFRPHSAFAHLTGVGADREPDAVLVLLPFLFSFLQRLCFPIFFDSPSDYIPKNGCGCEKQ